MATQPQNAQAKNKAHAGRSREPIPIPWPKAQPNWKSSELPIGSSAEERSRITATQQTEKGTQTEKYRPQGFQGKSHFPTSKSLLRQVSGTTRQQSSRSTRVYNARNQHGITNIQALNTVWILPTTIRVKTDKPSIAGNHPPTVVKGKLPATFEPVRANARRGGCGRE